jgi:hypothetical protein
MHVGDLEGLPAAFGKNWRATVTFTVHDGNHNPVANARVEGVWSNGYSGADSCVTDSSGSCSITTRKADDGSTAIVFTVTNITHSSLAYTSAGNHDADGDSDGRSIFIQKP